MYRKVRTILFISFLYFIVSCVQNPLDGFPKGVQDGVFNTGSSNIKFFNKSLYERLVKIDVINQSDLTMEWKEGKTDFYQIQVRLLHDLDSEYDFKVKDDFLSSLDGAEWSFDYEKNIGKLEWKPNRVFTGRESYRSLSIPLVLEFRKKGSSSENPDFKIERDLKAIVYNTLNEPEIYKVSTDYNEYVRLDDGYFYTKYGRQKINLNYYEKLYVGENKRKEIFNHFKFYTEDVRRVLAQPIQRSSPHHGGSKAGVTQITEEFDKLVLTDQFKVAVPGRLLDYIKQPIYYPEKISQSAGDCGNDKNTVLNDKHEKWCLAKLNTEDPGIYFNRDVYVKRYSIPFDVNTDNLYYKLDETYLCKIYHLHSWNYTITQNKIWDNNVPCYLPLAKMNKSKFVKEKEDIYILVSSESGLSMELLDYRPRWDFSFYKVPEFIKWQLGGYQPVSTKDNVLNLHLPNGYLNVLFYIRDYNYFEPLLVSSVREKNTFVFETIPSDMDIKISFVSSDVARNDDHNNWLIKYQNTFYNPIYELEDNTFRNFNLALKPMSGALPGDPILLSFNNLPFITAEYTEDFNPKSDLSDSASDIKIKDYKKDVMDSDGNLFTLPYKTFSISNRIKIKYTVPKNFLIDIHKITPIDQIPFYPKINAETEKVSDHINIKKLNPQCSVVEGFAEIPVDDSLSSNRENCSDGPDASGRPLCNNSEISVSRLTPSIVDSLSCDCSDFVEVKDGRKVYIESVCSYNTELKLLSDEVNNEGKPTSSYFTYDYSLFKQNNNIFLNNYFPQNIEENQFAKKEDVPINLKHLDFSTQYDRFLPKESVKTTQDIKNQMHLFFNLYPKIECVSTSDNIDVKKCSINYSLDNIVNNVINEDSNAISFSNTGIKAYYSLNASFQKIAGGTGSVCEKPTFSKENSIQVICSFSREEKGDISLYLETDNKYVYFLNTNSINTKNLNKYKRTDSTTLTIP